MNESEFQNIIAQQIIKWIDAKHSLYNLGVSSPPTNPSQKKYHRLQTESVTPREVVEGSGQLVTHPLPSLPPHRYFPTTQVPYQAVNRGGIITLRRHSKMGWNRRLQWNQLSASTPKKSSRDTEGAKSKYIPSDLFYFLSTVFHFQPPALLHNCTHFHSGLGNFFLKFFVEYTLLKNCWLHLGLLMWIQQRKEATKSLNPTRHTQKEIQKF